MKTEAIAFSLLLFVLGLYSANADSATWNLNPLNGDWNTAANWMPNTVPNGPNDTATFDVSNTLDISLSATTEVEGIVFNPGASAYTLTVPSPFFMTFSGTGIINNSGVSQTFVAATSRFEDLYPIIFFLNSATAGNSTSFTVEGGRASDFLGAAIVFSDNSSAGSGFFTVNSGAVHGASGGNITFENHSTAANGTFICNATEGTPGGIDIGPGASAGNGTFVLNDSSVMSIYGSIGDAVFTVNSSSDSESEVPSQATFFGATTVGNAIFTTNGGTVSGAMGGLITSWSSFDAGDSTIVANGGINGGEGGEVRFNGGSTAGNARVEVFGNGRCDISGHNAPPMSIGSLEGDGLVFLGSNNISVGGKDINTGFAGVIQDGGASGGTGGSVTKVGNGRLTLSGANTYTGGTRITAGVLKVENQTGSATGTGPMNVNGGGLGGSGIISGAVTVGVGSGTGAFLAPSGGSHQPATLTIESALTFKSDSTYTYKLNTRRAKADRVIANGVTIKGGAQFVISALADHRLTAGTIFTALSNTAATPVAGTFANLSDDSTVTVGRNTFQADYQGGDGNDLTLTVVP